MSEMDVDALQDRLGRVRQEVGKRIVGQKEVLEGLLACILADGNALLESNPGLGKTTMVRTLAEVTDLDFSRIQNTPDLMPSDITGTEIIREAGGEREFVFERGPVFANVVLADEINRATPKTQAALLEAMQEKQVTAAGETYELPRPFFVLATQNPIDQEGSLHPDESLYLGGKLWKASEAAEHAKERGELVHDGDRTRVWDIGGTTQALTADGEMVESEALVYESDYEGSVFTVETKTGRTIRVSDNHPFLVNRAGRMTWVQARNLDTGDHLVTPRQLDVPEGSFIDHEAGLDLLSDKADFQVVRAAEVDRLLAKLDRAERFSRGEIDDLRIAAGLSKKDLAGTVDASYDQVLGFLRGIDNGVGPTLQSALRDEPIKVGDYVESHTTHRIDDELTDADSGFFIGFLLAEGHVTDTAISVSQKNLPALLDRWIDIAESIGLSVDTRERPTGRTAQITSKPFVEYLRARYHLAEPERLLRAPETFRKEFLEAFILTESHFDTERRRITFVQKDETITNLIAHLLLGYGVVPWIYDRENRFELRIQGVDLAAYLDHFEWRGSAPDVDHFDTVHRTVPVDRNSAETVVDLLGLAADGGLSARPWYNSYRSLRSRPYMVSSYLQSFIDDADRTLRHRRSVDIDTAATDDIGVAAKFCGLSMTDIVENTAVSKHGVWQSYQTGESPSEAIQYVTDEYHHRIGEAEALVASLRGLIDSDVFYDRVTSIESEPYEGPVIGLSVPDHHNYVAGMGACGINHNTYPLPEAQTDRFLLKLLLDYPSEDEERDIVNRYTTGAPTPPVEKVLTSEEIREAQSLVREVPIADDIRDRAIRLVRATREADAVDFGASPRASMGIVLTAKARAFLMGRNHVSWEDIEAMAPPVLRHRILLDFRAEREGRSTDEVITDLLAEV